jgi:hypothetical protein
MVKDNRKKSVAKKDLKGTSKGVGVFKTMIFYEMKEEISIQFQCYTAHQ